MGKYFIIISVFLILAAIPALAEEGAAEILPQVAAADGAEASKTSSGLPIPRYVSMASDKVFVRTGPALRYPIKWIYQKDKMPVEVIQEFDTWRKVRDIDGDDGWIHQSLLSGERMVVTKGEQKLPLRREADANARVLAFFEPNVIATAESCAGAWCEISAQGYTGWAERKFLWGIYDAEDFD